MPKRTSKVLAVSVPPETARYFEELAEQEGRNKNELFREMLRICQSFKETGRFETLRRYDAARARALGVTTEQDVQRLIEEARRTEGRARHERPHLGVRAPPAARPSRSIGVCSTARSPSSRRARCSASSGGS